MQKTGRGGGKQRWRCRKLNAQYRKATRKNGNDRWLNTGRDAFAARKAARNRANEKDAAAIRELLTNLLRRNETV